jgi:exonuclease V gamma subunit
LIITCDGWDVKNNAKVPPAIAMEEFLEAVGSIDASAATGIICDHPRQIADERSFGGKSRLTEKFGGPFSPSTPALEVLQEIERNRGTHGSTDFDSYIYGNPPAEHALTVDDLALALNEPYRVLVEQRFDIRLPAESEAAAEDIDLVVGRLEEHQLGDGMLRALESGLDDLREWKQLRLKSGTLPPGKLGTLALSSVEDLVKAIHAKGVQYRDGKPAEVRAFNNSVSDPSVVITGNAVVYGNRMVLTTYAKQKRSRLIAPWFSIASLTLEYPDTEWEAVVLCSNDDRNNVTEDRYSIAGDSSETRQANARKILEFGVEMRRRALQSVLPVGTDASWLIGSGAAKTNVGNALKYANSYNDVYKLVRGIEDLWHLRLEEPIKGFDDTLADGLLTPDQLDREGVGYRARRYGKWFFNVWSNTTIEHTAKAKRGKK